MVGSSALSALLNEDGAREVMSLGRRPSGGDHAKLSETKFSSFGDAQATETHLNGIRHGLSLPGHLFLARQPCGI